MKPSLTYFFHQHISPTSQQPLGLVCVLVFDWILLLDHGKSTVDSNHSLLCRIANQYGIQGICNTADELFQCAVKEEALKCKERKNPLFKREFIVSFSIQVEFHYLHHMLMLEFEFLTYLFIFQGYSSRCSSRKENLLQACDSYSTSWNDGIFRRQIQFHRRILQSKKLLAWWFQKLHEESSNITKINIREQWKLSWRTKQYSRNGFW